MTQKSWTLLLAVCKLVLAAAANMKQSWLSVLTEVRILVSQHGWRNTVIVPWTPGWRLWASTIPVLQQCLVATELGIPDSHYLGQCVVSLLVAQHCLDREISSDGVQTYLLFSTCVTHLDVLVDSVTFVRIRSTFNLISIAWMKSSWLLAPWFFFFLRFYTNRVTLFPASSICLHQWWRNSAIQYKHFVKRLCGHTSLPQPHRTFEPWNVSVFFAQGSSCWKLCAHIHVTIIFSGISNAFGIQGGANIMQYNANIMRHLQRVWNI